jgi:hypothetical protein
MVQSLGFHDWRSTSAVSLSQHQRPSITVVTGAYSLANRTHFTDMDAGSHSRHAVQKSMVNIGKKIEIMKKARFDHGG